MAKGIECTCRVCGSKFINATVKSFMCPKCIEEYIARSKIPTPINTGREEKHNDDIMPQMEALKYATTHLEGDFVKKDWGKLQWSLMPFEELKDVVKVLMRGAEKYSPDNWKKCDDVTRYKDALMRHVVAYVSGDKIDSEFGLSHLAHAVCNCLFLMWFDNHAEDKRND